MDETLRSLGLDVGTTTTQLIISQLGGPDGELNASMRYLNQRYSMPYRDIVGILTDVGTED